MAGGPLKEMILAIGIAGLVCRGPDQVPVAQARPTESPSTVAATVATTAPITAAATVSSAPGAPEPQAASAPPGDAQPWSTGTVGAALAAVASSGETAPVGGAAVEPARRQVAPRRVTAAEDYTAILLAPVVGSPAAGQVPAGASLTVDAAVFGEEIEGSRDWYFVVHESEPALRGFIHTSRVRDPE